MTSAKIYQFPTRPRLSPVPVGNTSGEANLALPTMASIRVANASFGNGWYHDEAIREDERARRD
jgi:hypothetical protein